jgi:hypothetical protein
VKFWSTVALALLVACCGRPRQGQTNEQMPEPGKADPRIVEIDLTAGAPESSGDRLFQLPATRTYTGLVRALDRSLASKETAGLFVKLGSPLSRQASARGLPCPRSVELIGRVRAQSLQPDLA